MYTAISTPLIPIHTYAAATAVATISLLKPAINHYRDFTFGRFTNALKTLIITHGLSLSDVLCKVINNSITRRISPNVANWEQPARDMFYRGVRHIANASTSVVFAIYLVSMLSLSIIASVAACIPSIALLASCLAAITLWSVFSPMYDTIANLISGSSRTNVLSGLFSRETGAKLLTSSGALLLDVGSMFLISTLLPVLVPIYTISSLFRLNNRFNIYNYQNNLGVIHQGILDSILQTTPLDAESKSEPETVNVLEKCIMNEALTDAQGCMPSTLISSETTAVHYSGVQKSAHIM